MPESAVTRQDALQKVPATAVPSSPAPSLDELSWRPAVGGLSGYGPVLRRAAAQDAPSSMPASAAAQEASLSTPGSGVLVGPADDPAERAADQLADRALRRLTDQLHLSEAEAVPPVLRRSTTPPSTSSGGPGAEVIGAAGGELDARTAAAIRRSRGGGSTLPAPVRTRMETAFGQDLSAIRVHTDGQAADLNTAVSARAFTTGRDIFFGAGEYHPADADGEHVLAHEIAHAVTEPAGINRYLRRKLTKTSRDIAAVRSVRGQLTAAFSAKGAESKDTLSKLGALLDGYPREREPVRQKAALQVILALCSSYLTDNEGAGGDKKARIALVEDIKAEAFREMGQIAAQERYLDDAYGRGGTKTPMLKQREANITHPAAQALGAGKTLPHAAGADAVALELAQKYGLTEAEILAIKTFTADDYRYINPIVANDKDWWSNASGAIGEKPDFKDRSLKGIKDEGAVHGAVATGGMLKLPVISGVTTYRGMRLTKKKFEKDFVDSTTYTMPTLTSTSYDQDTAYGFASQGFVSTGPDNQDVRVLMEVTVTQGRDIKALSNITGEEEVALLPGAQFTITNIKDESANGYGPGTPPAKHRKRVYLTQIK